MHATETHVITPDEIAHLAYLNWQKEGCLTGRDQNYWLEAEQQLKATKHLLTKSHQAGLNAAKVAPQPPVKATRKNSARTKLA